MKKLSKREIEQALSQRVTETGIYPRSEVLWTLCVAVAVVIVAIQQVFTHKEAPVFRNTTLATPTSVKGASTRTPLVAETDAFPKISEAPSEEDRRDRMSFTPSSGKPKTPSRSPGFSPILPSVLTLPNQQIAIDTPTD